MHLGTARRRIAAGVAAAVLGASGVALSAPAAGGLGRPQTTCEPGIVLVEFVSTVKAKGRENILSRPKINGTAETDITAPGLVRVSLSGTTVNGALAALNRNTKKVAQALAACFDTPQEARRWPPGCRTGESRTGGLTFRTKACWNADGTFQSTVDYTGSSCTTGRLLIDLKHGNGPSGSGIAATKIVQASCPEGPRTRIDKHAFQTRYTAGTNYVTHKSCQSLVVGSGGGNAVCQWIDVPPVGAPPVTTPTTPPTTPAQPPNWTHWDTIGDCGSGSPRISNGLGAVSVAFRGCDDRLWVRTSTTMGESWGALENMLTVPAGALRPACARGSAELVGTSTQLDLYTRECGTNSMWHRAKRGTTWGPWRKIVGAQTCAHGSFGDPSARTSAAYRDVFFVGCGSNGNTDIVHLRSQPYPGNDDSWTQVVIPNSVTGCVKSRPRPVFTSTRIYLFYVSCVGEARYVSRGVSGGAWARWRPVGPQGRCIQGEPGVIQKQTGTIDVYGVECAPPTGTSDTTGAIIHTRFGEGPQSWSAWQHQNRDNGSYGCHAPDVAITSYHVSVVTAGCTSRRVFVLRTNNDTDPRLPDYPENLEMCTAAMPATNWTGDASKHVLMIAITGCPGANPHGGAVSFGRYVFPL